MVLKLLTKPRADEIPHDYWFEVGSFQSIPPGKGLFFSVPVNHVEQRWHFEIPFRFELPKGERSRDPNVWGLPEMFGLLTPSLTYPWNSFEKLRHKMIACRVKKHNASCQQRCYK